MQTQTISLWQRILAMFTAVTMLFLMVPQASLPVYAEEEGIETIQLTVNITVKDENGQPVQDAKVTADEIELGVTDADGVYNKGSQSFTVPVGTAEITIKVIKDGYPTKEFTEEIGEGNAEGERSVSYINNSIRLERTFAASVSGETITVRATEGSKFFDGDSIALDNGAVTLAGSGFTVAADATTATAQIASVTGTVGEPVKFNVTVNGKSITENPLQVTVPGATLSVKNGEEAVSQLEIGESATLVPVFYSLGGEESSYTSYTYQTTSDEAVEITGNTVKAVQASDSVTITVTDQANAARTASAVLSTVKKSNGVLRCTKLGENGIWQTTYNGASQALTGSDFTFNGQSLGDAGNFAITYQKNNTTVAEVKDAGTYTFTAAYSDATYEEASLSGRIVIEQASAGAVIEGAFPQSVTYGDSVTVQVSANVPGTWSGNGVVAGSFNSGDSTIRLNTTAAAENLDIKFTPEDSINYRTETVQTFTVQKKELTVTVTFPDKPFDNGTAVVANMPVPKADYDINHTDGDAYYEVEGLTAEDEAKTFATTLAVNDFAFNNKGSVGSTTENVPIAYHGSAPAITLDGVPSENYQVTVTANPAHILSVDFSGQYSLPSSDVVPQYVDESGVTWYQGSTITVTAADGYYIAAGTLDLDADPFAFGNAESVALSPDANHSLSFYLREQSTDAISRQTVSNVRVDDAAPAIDLAKVAASNQKADGTDFDASNTSLTYTIALHDAGCGLDTTKVFYAVTTDAAPAEENWRPVTPVQAGNTDDYTITLTTSESGSTIYVKASDKVDNTDEEFIVHPLVIEQGSPKIDTFTVDNTEAKNSHILTLAAHDVGTGNSDSGYSGIAKVTYTVVQTHTKDGVEIPEGQRSEMSNALPAVSRTGVTYETLANYKGYPAAGEDATVTLEAINGVNLNGTYSVTVTVSDFCGNSAQKTISGIIIDHIAPKATVRMGAQAASDGNYYYSYDNATHAQDAKVSIQLSDTNISKGLTYTVTVDGTPLSSFENKTNSDGTLIEIPAAVLGEKADGTHSLGITVADQAGNRSATEDVTFIGMLPVSAVPDGVSHQASVVVDKTAPVVSLVVGAADGTPELTGNLVGGVWYHNADNSQLAVTIQDEHAGATGAKASYQVSVGTKQTNDGEESNGTRTITLDSSDIAALGDGEKTVEIVAVDAAGNAATTLTATHAVPVQGSVTAKFYLDTTAPVLNRVLSTDSYDQKLYENDTEIYYSRKVGDRIDIHYGIDDVNYKTDYVTATVLKNGQEMTAEEMNAAQITFTAENASDIVVSIPIQEAVERDVYSVQIAAQDKALNKLVKKANLQVAKRDEISGSDGAFTTVCQKVVDTVVPVMTLDYTAGAHFYQEGAGQADYTAYYKNDFTADFSFADAGGLDTEKIGTGEIRADAGSTQFEAQNAESISGDTHQKTVSYSITSDGTYKFQAYGEDRAGNALQVYEKKTSADTAQDDVKTGCDAAHVFTGYAKVRDTVAPVAEISYTKADEEDDVSHYYTKDAAGNLYEGGASYAFYNKAFAVNYKLDDAYGVDQSKIYTIQNGVSLVYGDAASYVDWAQTSLNRNVYTIEAASDHSNDEVYVFGIYGEDKAGNALIVAEDQTASDDTSHRYEAGYAETNPYISIWKKVMDTTSPAVRLEIKPESTVINKDLQEYIPGDKRYFFNGKFTALVTVTDTNYDDQRVFVRYGKQTAEGDCTIQTIANDLLNQPMPAPVPSEAFTKYQYTLADQAGEGVYRFVAAGEDRAGNPTVLAAVPAGEQSNFNESVADNSVGNQSGAINTFRSHYVVVDTVAPRLTVTVDSFYKAILNENREQTGSLFTVKNNDPYQQKSEATLTLSSEDHSPVVVQYGADSTVETQKFQFVNTDDGSTSDIQKWKYYAGDQKVDVHAFDARQTLWLTHLTATDLAGNTSTAPNREGENAVTNKLYLDTDPPRFDETEPFMDLKFSKALPSTVLGNGAHGVEGTPLTNETVVIKAEIQDPTWNSNSGANASGIYKIYYKVEVPDADSELVGKVSHDGLTAPVAWFSGQTDFGVSAAVAGTTGEITYGYGPNKYTADTKNYKLAGKVDLAFTFDAADFNYNQITLTVWAEDNAGYVCQQNKITFAIDTTVPTITVQYDNNDARNEKYFKEDRRATVTVTERNFDEETTQILTETAASISGWTHTNNGGNGDQDTWTATVLYDKDGNYTFAVDTKDRVNFSCPDEKVDYSGSVAPKEFVIDKTIPVIEVTFDNNNVANGKYYRDARVATILITEHNFDATDAKVETTAAIAEGAVAAPAVSGWGGSGDANSTTVGFHEDGDYTMSVDFMDKAGNEAVTVTVDEFTVDQTPPELEISINGEAKDPEVDLMQAYNGEVAPSITYHDVNYRQAGTSVTITGYQNTTGTNLNGHAADNEFGGSFVCDNIEEIPANDDVYTCVGHVEDMAGNESDVEIRFSVNRFGSNYILSAQTQELIDRRYTNSRPVIEVTEINVDTLEFQEITTSMNGSLVTLQEGTDYTVTESGDASTWKQYQYMIRSEVFDADGTYDLTIHSRDAASNENSNRTSQVEEYVKPIHFVLDMTAPTAVITGVENDQQYIEESRLVTVYLEDNIRLDHADIYLDDTVVASYNEESLADNGTLTYQATSKNGWQNFRVVAADKAGNVVAETSVRFLLTKNLFVQYINNTPAVVASTVSVGGIAGLLIFLMKKKKMSLLALLQRR